MHSIGSTRTLEVKRTLLDQPTELNMPVSCTRTPAHIPGEFSFPLVELEDSWELGKGDMEAYVKNIKSVTSAVR